MDHEVKGAWQREWRADHKVHLKGAWLRELRKGCGRGWFIRRGRD